MEVWAIILLFVVLVLLVIMLTYFIMKLYFPIYFRSIFPKPQETDSPGEDKAYASGRLHTSFGYELDRAAGTMLRTMSVDSVASDISAVEMGPSLSPLGQVEVGLEYDTEVRELVVSVIQVKDLKREPQLGIAMDHYVKIEVHPSTEEETRLTKIQKKTSDPVFKERFSYDMEQYEVPTKTVIFSVMSIDTFTNHSFVGKAMIDLVELELVRPFRLWLNLQDDSMLSLTFGELLFSISYLPTAERLTVVVVKGKNLKWRDDVAEVEEVFVKVHLLENSHRIAKRKTAAKRGETQPSFNEAMIFSVGRSMLNNIQLRFSVMERVGRRVQSVGHVMVGASAAGKELTHWQHMLMMPRKPVAMWHQLRRQIPKKEEEEEPEVKLFLGAEEPQDDIPITLAT